MSSILLGVLGFVVLLVLIGLGLHIPFALGITGLFGLLIKIGFTRTIGAVASITYYTIASIDFTVIPLFVLMGMLATSVGASTAAYDCMVKWIGRVPGGLGVATTVGCAAFGTLNGSAMVTCSVFTKASAPEMIKYGYDKKVTYGLICGAGCIGQLIPPSVVIVLYGAISEVSIGQLLMAGISPGLALTLVYSLMMVFIGIVWPKKVPIADVHFTWKERIRSLTGLIPIALVALIIIGGIFSGIFSSCEAGAIGCLVFFAYALINRVSWRVLVEAFKESILTYCMLLVIFICAGTFAKFITVTGLAQAMLGLAAGGSPFMFMVIAVVIYLILGCFLDATSILTISIPIFLPLSRAMGIDDIQFAMVTVLALHCGMLTPPVGTECFTAASASGGNISIEDAFRGAFPFLVAMVAVTAIYALIPQLSTFIPNMMMN